MLDISMCQNKECPLCNTCYRFLATPDPYMQSYSDFAPDGNGDCEYYWDDGTGPYCWDCWDEKEDNDV